MATPGQRAPNLLRGCSSRDFRGGVVPMHRDDAAILRWAEQSHA
ncbi:MAG: hypothetical protein R2788_17870 [Saprospiraceae bacterium]